MCMCMLHVHVHAHVHVHVTCACACTSLIARLNVRYYSLTVLTQVTTDAIMHAITSGHPQVRVARKAVFRPC